MLKLSDKQVNTLLFILIHKPHRPRDLERFPTVKLFIEKDFVRIEGDRLVLGLSPELSVYIATFDDKSIADVRALKARNFDDLDSNRSLDYYADATPRDEDGTFHWELVNLCEKFKELGGRVNVKEGTVHLPNEKNAADECATLIDAFITKYPESRRV